MGLFSRERAEATSPFEGHGVTQAPVPLGDRVIIRPIVEDEVTAGGIIKPDIAREKPTRGTVIAVGEELLSKVDASWANQHTEAVAREMMGYVPAKLNAGEEVLYGKYSGIEFEFEGETFLIVRYPDILAVYR